MEESQGILNTNMERKARVSSWVSINPKACGMINEDLKQEIRKQTATAVCKKD